MPGLLRSSQRPGFWAVPVSIFFFAAICGANFPKGSDEILLKKEDSAAFFWPVDTCMSLGCGDRNLCSAECYPQNSFESSGRKILFFSVRQRTECPCGLDLELITS